jgi:hypothetical protein
MEEAITKFLDGMEGQERSGFKDLHRFLGRLPLPVAKEDSAMLHSEALQGGFIPKMDEEEQKRFTQSELLLYRRLRIGIQVLCSYTVHTLYILKHFCSYLVHTLFILEHFCSNGVHTRYIREHFCSYVVYTLYILHHDTLYIHCTYMVFRLPDGKLIQPDGKLKCVWYMFVPVMSSIDQVCTEYILSTNQVYKHTGQHHIFLNRTDRYALMN